MGKLHIGLHIKTTTDMGKLLWHTHKTTTDMGKFNHLGIWLHIGA